MELIALSKSLGEFCKQLQVVLMRQMYANYLEVKPALEICIKEKET